jgi:hypothetical protein
MRLPSTETAKDDLAIIAAAIFVVFVNLCAWSMLADGDTAWHLAAGQWILAHRAIPVTDPFSLTAAGTPWIAHEWLAEAAMGLAYAGAGWSGVSLLFACAGMALFLIIGLHLRRWLPPLAVFAALIILFLILQPFLLARPHMLAWPLLALWVLGLFHARERSRPPAFTLLPLLIVWANLHGSFILGILLIGPFALEALAVEPDKRRAFLGWSIFGLSALAAGCLTPHGPMGLVFPLQVSTMDTLPLIREWQATNLLEPTAFSLTLVAGLIFAIWRGLKVPPLRLLLLLGLLVMAFQHQRHQAVFGIIAMVILAEPVAACIRPATAPKSPFLTAVRQYKLQVGLFAILLLAIAVVRLAVPMSPKDSMSVPASALAALPARLKTVPVFNYYDFGGALILAGVRPFIDGRADLYGDAFVRSYSQIADGDMTLFNRARQRWKIGWVILAPHNGLVARLESDPMWQIVYTDRNAVIIEHIGDKAK